MRFPAFARFLSAALMLAGAPLLAQTSVTTGAIRGRVNSEAGDALANATVSATNQETGLVRNALTGEDGSFLLRFLPPGSYRVSARRLGSAPAEQSNVRVVVGATASATFALRASATTLTAVTVTAGPRAIDVSEAGVKTTVAQEQIENLPTLGRDFTDFIALSGMVSPTPEATTGGQFSIAGQRPSQTNIQIDGVDANNQFFGENRGGSRIPFNFSLESIREFQVITNGYDVEYGNYSGGVVNIVTKGGTNRFNGSVYGNYRGASLTAKNFDALRTDPRDFEVQQYAARVSGPIIKDRLFYFLSTDIQRRREPFNPTSPRSLRADSLRFISGATADTSAANTDTASRNGARRDITSARSRGQQAAALDSFYGILGSRYGIDSAAAARNYEEFTTTNDVLTLFGRVDWNLSENNRFTVRHNFSDFDNLNEAGGAAVLAGLSQAEAFRNKSNSLVGELNSTIRDRFYNVFRIQYSDETRPRRGNDLRPELRINSLTANSAVEYGGSFISFNNYLREKKVQLINNVSFDIGRHGLKLGTNNTFAHLVNRFHLNGSGGFEFADLTAFREGRASRYNRNVRANGTTPNATFDAQEYSAYAQDDFQLTSNVLVSLGLRYDVARYGDRPGRVFDVERALGFRTGYAPIDDNNISPRASVAWDRKGDGTEVFRLGGGLFYGRVPYVVGSNVAITDQPLLVLDCRGSAAENAPDAPPSLDGFADLPRDGSGNPSNCAGNAGVGGVPEYSFWNDNFEVPETYKGNVGYERALGGRTRLKLDYVYTASNKLYTVRNLNLRDSVFSLTNEGGRRVFVPQTRFQPNTSAGVDRLRYTDFANLYVNYNDGVSRAQAASVELARTVLREVDSASVTASYTFTRAFDNSSFSCCTSAAGFSDTRVGARGPNEIGGVGDEDSGWGPSAFVRNHTVVLTGNARLPFGFRVTGIFRAQSGTPYGPEQSGDANGDGQSFNDRPFIFHPESLPVSLAPALRTTTNPDSIAIRDGIVFQNRDRYRGYLNNNSCISEYVGRIIPRNTCRQPWFNRLDLSVRKQFQTVAGQKVQFEVDMFNVLNGLNNKWGRYEAVTAANRNLLTPQSFNSTTSKVEYTVPPTFGSKTPLGTNLLLQFSAQLGARYYF